MKFPIFLFISLALLKIGLCNNDGGAESQNSQLKSPISRAKLVIEVTKEIVSIQTGMAKTLIDQNLVIGKFKKNVRNEIKKAKGSINDDVDDINQNIKRAQRESGDKVAMCVKSAKKGISQISTRELSKCKKSLSFNLLKLDVGKLVFMQGKLNTVIPTCSVLHPFSDKNFKTCIENSINKNNDGIEEIKKKVQVEGSYLVNTAKDCVAENKRVASLAVKMVSDDFDQCVKDHTRKV